MKHRNLAHLYDTTFDYYQDVLQLMLSISDAFAEHDGFAHTEYKVRKKGEHQFEGLKEQRPGWLLPLAATVEALCCSDGSRGWRLESLEKGGAGDCLFFAAAGGLQSLAACVGAENERLCGILRVQSLECHESLADQLRKFAAARFSKKTPEDLLNAALSYVGQHKQTSEPWHDKCCPRKLMIQCGFESLLPWQVVSAVGANEDGEPDDLLIWAQNSAEQCDVIRVDGGVSKLNHLRNQFWGIYARPYRANGWHWGAHEDVLAMADFLSIGFCVFSTTPMGGAGARPMHIHFGDAAIVVHVRR